MQGNYFFEDEFDEDELPYSDVGNLNQSQEQSQDQAQGAGPSPDVMGAISARRMPASNPMLEMAGNSNMGQAASIMAGGVNLSDDRGLYSNMNTQMNNVMSQDLRRDAQRRLVENQIFNRNRQGERDQKTDEYRKDLLTSRDTGRADRKDKTDQINAHKQDMLIKTIDKELKTDSVINNSTLNLQSLMKSKQLLDNNNLPLTSQVLADAESDIASALSLRPRGATEGAIHRTEMQSMGRDWANLRQRIGDKPINLREKIPHIVDQLKKVNQALIDDYKHSIAARNDELFDAYDALYGHNPAYSERLKALRQLKRKQMGMQEGGNSGLVKMIFPKGPPKSVPADQVQEALQNGGMLSNE